MPSLATSIHPQEGSHPTLTTKINLGTFLAHNCSLLLYQRLPPLVFIDPYELTNHQEFFTFVRWATTSLELPVTAVSQDDFDLLLDVNIPPDASELKVNLPLHLRYGDPTKSTSGYQMTGLDWPKGFLACPKPALGLEGAADLGLLPEHVAAVFDTQRNVFSTVNPENDQTNILIRAPIGRATDLARVEFFTTFTILLSFIYILHASFQTSSRLFPLRSKSD